MIRKKKFIWFRNGMFQITYGNTDKYKMYAYDTLNTRYVNKLDLYAHSYLNATGTFNILTYILGENWKAHYRDMTHIYPDFITSLLVTNVTDTTAKNNTCLKKTINVKSNTYGVALNAKFNNAFDSKFTIKAGWKLFWIIPSSSSVSGNLNPHNTNIPDIHSCQNSTKTFDLGRNFPYLTFDVLMQYNTSKKEDNNLNIFFHYAFTSIYANKKIQHFTITIFNFKLVIQWV